MPSRWLFAVLVAGIAAACNGAPPDTLAGEIAAVCNEANAELDAIPAPSSTSEPAELAAFFRRTAAANRTAASRVAGLEASAELLAGRDALVDSITDVAGALEAAATAVEDGDETALGEARDELLEARERFDDLAAELGAGPCLRSRSPSPGT